MRRLLYFLPLLISSTAYAANGSTVTIDPLGRGTWIVDQERQEVALISVFGDVQRIGVGAWPEELVVKSDGTVFVSCRQQGTIDVITPAYERSSIPVGVEPKAIALDESGESLYVALVNEHAVARIDTRSKQVLTKRHVDFSPYTMALVPNSVAVAGAKDDSVMFLSRALGADPAPVVFLRPKEGSNRRPWHIQALASDGDRVFVVHANVDTGLSSTSFGGGYGGDVMQPIVMAVSVIRAGDQTTRPKLLGHAGDIEVKDAQGALVHDGLLYVASRGTKQLVVASILDEENGRVKITPSEALNVGPGVTGVAIAADGRVETFVAYRRELAEVTVRAQARALLADPDHATFGTNSIAAGIYSTNHPLKLHKKMSIGAGAYDEELALGRELFHDALSTRISSGETGCVTCHPDGREDGLVWRLGGTRRQTPLLAGRVEGTAPFNWEGTTERLEDNIQQTIARLGGMGINKKETHALARFLTEGLPKPQLAPVADAAAIVHGKELFFDATVGCASCHPPAEQYTDGTNWNVESTGTEELAELKNVRPPRFVVTTHRPREVPRARVINRAPLEYNTPSLKYVSLTAPYFHDGSAQTLDQLIAANNDRMGTTTQLGEEDRRALVAYLSSL